ncbi:DUF7344 domain-containing protein [Natrinema versiforme]|uniref:DUF7344 domain-containing protein n=1 Tax=Natrinema versiforme JCM 10478 TaxID=1227496 RepID=L9YAT1_9EURY|nr:hypothetical protein [Natrinema versiforme]ELY71184.1 hypothetical protein C489_00796 [Natrinema versiforme JCM 10478]
MSSHPDTEMATALDVLAEPKRRYVLAALLDREGTSAGDATSVSASDPMSIAALATEVATIEYNCPIVTDDQCEEVHVSLVHNHVPRLIDSGVLCHPTSDDATRVALADHPLFALDWVQPLLADPTGETVPVDESTLNRTLTALRNPRSRAVCAALARRRGSVAVADLAAAVVAREGGDGTQLVDVTEAECRTVATALAHEHLPALSEAGLVAYDDLANGVELATDAPQWQVDWLADGPLGEAADLVRDAGDRQADTAETGTAIGESGTASTTPKMAGNGDGTDIRTDTCWTLQGRANVLDRGREIVDGADEELFVMVPTGEMIRPACLERWLAAADRGVDVYVASRSPRVRDTVRSAVPTATVCEPQFDWLTFPMEGERHGCVVFADRESAMLVTIDESGPGGEPRVGAITGDGRANALVSVVCDRLGPRLDRLTPIGDDRDGTPLPL